MNLSKSSFGACEISPSFVAKFLSPFYDEKKLLLITHERVLADNVVDIYILGNGHIN